MTPFETARNAFLAEVAALKAPQFHPHGSDNAGTFEDARAFLRGFAEAADKLVHSMAQEVIGSSHTGFEADDFRTLIDDALSDWNAYALCELAADEARREASAPRSFRGGMSPSARYVEVR